MKYFHGTSFNNGMNIIKNGFAGDIPGTIWNCSNDSMLYLAASTADADEDCYDEGFALANDAAKIAAAVFGQDDTRVVIFEFDIPNDVIEKYVEEDDSCENMSNCYQIDRDDLQKLIDSESISVIAKFYNDAYIPYLRPFYLSGLRDNAYFNELNDPLLVQAINIVADSGAFIEDLLYHGEPGTAIKILPKQKTDAVVITA